MASSEPSGSKERRLSSQQRQNSSLQFLPPFLLNLGFRKGEQSPWASPSTPIYYKSDLSESASGMSSSQNDPGQPSGSSSSQNDTDHPLIDLSTQDENASVASLLGVTGAASVTEEDDSTPLIRRSTPGVRVRESSLERATYYGVPLTRPFKPVQLATAFRWGPPAYRPLQEQIMHMRSSPTDSWKFRAVIRTNDNPSYMHYVTIDKLGSDSAITKRARGRLMFQRDLVTFLLHLGVRINRDPMTYIEEDFATNYVTCNYKYWTEDPGNMYAEEAFYYLYRADHRTINNFWQWFTGVNVEVKDEGISSAMTFPDPDYFFGSLLFTPNARGSCWRNLFDGPIYGDHQDWPTVSMVRSLAREYPLSQKAIFRAINTGGNKVHIFLDGNNTAEEVLGMFEPGAKIGGKEDFDDSDVESDVGYEKSIDADTAAAARQLLGASFGTTPKRSNKTRPRRKVKQAASENKSGNILDQLIRFKDGKTKTHLVLRPADTIEFDPFISDLDLPLYNTPMAAILHARGCLAFNSDIHSLLAKVGSSMYGEPQDYIISNTVMTFMSKVCKKSTQNIQPYHSFIFGHHYAASLQFRELFWTWFTGFATTLQYSPEGWAQFDFSGVAIDDLLLENFESHHNGECWRLLFQGPVKSQGPEHASRFLTKHNILVINEDYKYASRNDLTLTKDGHMVHVSVGGNLSPEQVVDMLDFRDTVGGYYHSPRNLLLSYFVNQSDDYKRHSRLAPFFKWLGGFPPSYPDNTTLCVQMKVSELETALYGYRTLSKFLYCESEDKTAIYLPGKPMRWRLSFDRTEPLMRGLQVRGERLQISFRRFCFLTISVIAWFIVLLDLPTTPVENKHQVSSHGDSEDIPCDMTFAQTPFWTLSLHHLQQPLIIAMPDSGNREGLAYGEPQGNPVVTWKKVKPPDWY